MMSPKELHEMLAKYVGLRVRISSDATSSGLWRDSYPELVEVITRDLDGAVCCKTNDGVWSIVIEDGLRIEVEPAIGTHDFAKPAKQMEMIHVGLVAYGEAEPSPPPDNPRRRRRLDLNDW